MLGVIGIYGFSNPSVEGNKKIVTNVCSIRDNANRSLRSWTNSKIERKMLRVYRLKNDLQ